MEYKLHFLLMIMCLSSESAISSNHIDLPMSAVLSTILHNYLKETTKGSIPWNFSLLGEHLQSPVDIITLNARETHDLHPLIFTAHNSKEIKSTIINSGHGVTVKLQAPNELKPQLSGAFLDDTYIFENIHAHWGKADYFGSEHFINGESYSLEGHMVTYKKAYGNLNNALNYKDGIVVFTFFGKVHDKEHKHENNDIEHLLKYIPQIEKSKSSITVTSANPVLCFFPKVMEYNSNKHYFAYPGSLTTPPYTESVTFIILPKPIPITRDQLRRLRTLKDTPGQPVETNRRELQPLRGRPLLCAKGIQWNIFSKWIVRTEIPIAADNSILHR